MDSLYRLKSLKELMDEIAMGMDIEFLLYGIRYNISWRDEKPFICICPAGDAVSFDSPEVMFDQAGIE